MSFILRSVLITVSLLLAWQISVMAFQIPEYLLPSPIQTFTTFYSQKYIILRETLPTLVETLLGFFLGILFGCFAAIVIILFKPLKHWAFPLLIISQAIPTFAIAPLLVLWLGFGLASKIATTTLMIFFPIMSAFYDGLKRTPSNWLDLAQMMRASKWRILWYIRIPAALPTLASGIRVAAVIAPIGAIIGEWVGASEGLGYLMLNANARLQVDVMFSALMIIILLSLLLYFLVDTFLRYFIWWQSP